MPSCSGSGHFALGQRKRNGIREASHVQFNQWLLYICREF
jgi:hypothetical protein